METVECLEDIRPVIQRGPGRFPNTHTVAPQGLAYILIPLFAKQPTQRQRQGQTQTHSCMPGPYLYIDFIICKPTYPKAKTNANAKTATKAFTGPAVRTPAACLIV